MKDKSDWWNAVRYFGLAISFAAFMLLSDLMPNREWRIAGWVVVAVTVACGLSYLLRRSANP
jgi:presenilin-like A22 family membrane protease